MADPSPSFLSRAMTKVRQTRLMANPGPKTVSAMIRVRDEADFLDAAVRSIADQVEEIVLIDNLSTDATPDIIARLAADYPGKVRAFRYDHAIRRVGKDNEALARDPEGRTSPELLANFYNWCLQKCTQNYVLKWDGDMIATDAFKDALAAFRSRPQIYSLQIKGVNVHANRTHLIDYDSEELRRLVRNAGDGTDGTRYRTVRDNWLQPETDYEARLFPRSGAIYDTGFWWCEKLNSPYVDGLQGLVTRVKWRVPAYLHLKYCKADPFANLSPDFQTLITGAMRVGRSLTPSEHSQLCDATEHNMVRAL